MVGRGQVMLDMSRGLAWFWKRIVALFLLGGVSVETADSSAPAKAKHHAIMLFSPKYLRLIAAYWAYHRLVAVVRALLRFQFLKLILDMVRSLAQEVNHMVDRHKRHKDQGHRLSDNYITILAW